MSFPVVIHKDINSDYGVTVPDLPGCFSAGESMEEALSNAKEAIECHLEGMMEDNEQIPVPQPIAIHQTNSEYANGTWAIVEVNLSKLTSKAKRINITLPEHLLDKVDRYTEKHGITRSGLLAQSVTEHMAKKP